MVLTAHYFTHVSLKLCYFSTYIYSDDAALEAVRELLSGQGQIKKCRRRQNDGKSSWNSVESFLTILLFPTI